MDNDNSGSGETDYRSHYDLGMAYIEMDLHTEAIREYQLAAKSPQFQVKCLEMIGLCFIKQNQPQLAIRQLSKGLSLIGADSEESLGIKYNLGLAHEMIGDLGNARTYFEDVYVVDVSFRDVSDKVRRLAGTTS
jgi:tetratricopeptide (TPR) repeat protein